MKNRAIEKIQAIRQTVAKTPCTKKIPVPSHDKPSTPTAIFNTANRKMKEQQGKEYKFNPNILTP